MADESIGDLLLRILARLVLVLVLVAIFGGRCKSASGAGQLRAEKINTGLDGAVASIDDLEGKINRSSATPQEKAEMISTARTAKSKIQEQKPAVTGLGKDTDTFQTQAQNNAVDAGRMRLLYWLAGIGVFLLGIYLFRSRLLKWFTPMLGRSG